MSSISASDLRIIVKGAIHMAQQDNKVVSAEEGLIRNIIKAGNIEADEFSDLNAPLEDDISELSQQLSDDRAKKVFLLTLFSVAYSDKDFDESEQELLDALSQKLGVGKIKMDGHTMEACEKEVIKLITG
jgi:uncharacterized tellurite resistance protein B-like protein